MKLHVASLPHTETTTEFDWCAFTSKTRKFATMMTRQGYDVRLYAGEANEAECAEHVTVVTRAEQAEWFGHYDWSRDLWNEYDPDAIHWRTMNARAIAAIGKRLTPGDVICIIAGRCQQEIATAFPLNRSVEWGIGYRGVFAPFRVFESYAWAHHLAHPDDIRFFDTVIPNSFEPELFPAGPGNGAYYLYFGRLIERKGAHIAALACEAIGARLIVAGQGCAHQEPGLIVAQDGTELRGDVCHLGVITDPVERAALMGAATAIFVPTIYLEPFGAVAVEAMMTGTPAICSDWGAFTETVQPGMGFLCRTLGDFVEAAQIAPKYDRRIVRDMALSRYTVDVAAAAYDRYFTRLATLDGAGWYDTGSSA